RCSWERRPARRSGPPAHARAWRRSSRATVRHPGDAEHPYHIARRLRDTTGQAAACPPGAGRPILPHPSSCTLVPGPVTILLGPTSPRPGGPMLVEDAQREVRLTFVGGAVGQLVSALVWATSAAFATWGTPRQAITVLVVGGVFIFPLTQLGLRLAGRKSALS